MSTPYKSAIRPSSASSSHRPMSPPRSDLGHLSSSHRGYDQGHTGYGAPAHHAPAATTTPGRSRQGSARIDLSVVETNALFDWITAMSGIRTDSIDDLADGVVLSKVLQVLVPAARSQLAEIQDNRAGAPLRDSSKIKNLAIVAGAISYHFPRNIRINMTLPDPGYVDPNNSNGLFELGVATLLVAAATGAPQMQGDKLLQRIPQGQRTIDALRGIITRFGNDTIDDVLAAPYPSRTSAAGAAAANSPYRAAPGSTVTGYSPASAQRPQSASTPQRPIAHQTPHSASAGVRPVAQTPMSTRSDRSNLSLSDSLNFPVVPFDPSNDLSARKSRTTGNTTLAREAALLGQIHVTIVEGLNLVEQKFLTRFMHLRIDIRLGQHSFHSSLQPASVRARFDETSSFEVLQGGDEVMSVTVYGRTKNHDYILGSASVPLHDIMASRGQEISREYQFTPSDPQMKPGSVVLKLSFLHPSSGAVTTGSISSSTPASRSIAGSTASSYAAASRAAAPTIAGNVSTAAGAAAGVSTAAVKAAAQAPAVAPARLAAAPNISAKELQEIKTVFEKYDKDKNGYIDAKELRELCTSLNYYISKDEKYNAFEEIDKDGNGKIDFNEFAIWWSATEERRNFNKQNQKVSTAKVATLKAKAAVSIAKNSYMTWRNLYARMKDGDRARLGVSFKSGQFDANRPMQSEFIFDLDRLQPGEFEKGLRAITDNETPRTVECFARIQMTMTRESSSGARQAEFMRLLEHSMDSLEDDLSDALREIFTDPTGVKGPVISARTRLVKCIALIAEDRGDGDILEVRIFMDKDPLIAFDGIEDLKVTLSSPLRLDDVLRNTRETLAGVLEKLVGLAVVKVEGTRKALMTLSRVFAMDEYATVLATGVSNLNCDVVLRRLIDMVQDMAVDPGNTEKERAELAKDLRGSVADFLRDAEDDIFEDETYLEYPAIAVAAEHLRDLRSVVIMGRSAKITCSSKGLDLFRMVPMVKLDMRQVEATKAKNNQERAVKDQVKLDNKNRVSPALLDGSYKPKATVAAAAPPPATKPGYQGPAGSSPQHHSQPHGRPNTPGNRADTRFDTHNRPLSASAGPAAARPMSPGIVGGGPAHAAQRPISPGAQRPISPHHSSAAGYPPQYGSSHGQQPPAQQRPVSPNRPITPNRYDTGADRYGYADQGRGSRPVSPGSAYSQDPLYDQRRTSTGAGSHISGAPGSRPMSPAVHGSAGAQRPISPAAQRPTTPAAGPRVQANRYDTYDDGRSAGGRTSTGGYGADPYGAAPPSSAQPERYKSPNRVTYADDLVRTQTTSSGRPSTGGSVASGRPLAGPPPAAAAPYRPGVQSPSSRGYMH